MVILTANWATANSTRVRQVSLKHLLRCPSEFLLGPVLRNPSPTILDPHSRTFDVPASAIGIRHLDTNESVFVDSAGSNVGSLSQQHNARTQTQPSVSVYGLVPEEAKRIIGACLGCAWEGGPLTEGRFPRSFRGEDRDQIYHSAHWFGCRYWPCGWNHLGVHLTNSGSSASDQLPVGTHKAPHPNPGGEPSMWRERRGEIT
ncbi:hypothetical protein CAPI_01275 [Corynebacterium capitovis DSM 44611]|nr:hypothetical protein CAPI_01275 [Corynebacterium capitovis DSM 44611]